MEWPFPTEEELIQRFGPVEDPDIEARRQKITRVLVRMTPEIKQELIDEGRLVEARAALRRVLAVRQLTPSQEESTRIEACTDLATLKRWLNQAVTAATVSAALS